MAGGWPAAGVVGPTHLLRLCPRDWSTHVHSLLCADLQAIDVHVQGSGQLVPVRLHGGGGLHAAVRAGRVRRRHGDTRLHDLVPEHRGAVPQLRERGRVEH